MDLQMPRMDGVDATASCSPRQIERFPDHRDDANVLEEDRRACEAAGMSDFIAKPVDHDQLCRVLQLGADRCPWLRDSHFEGKPPSDAYDCVSRVGCEIDPDGLVHLKITRATTSLCAASWNDVKALRARLIEGNRSEDDTSRML